MNGQEIIETVKIFRKRFISPITLFPILLYFQSLNSERLLKFFNLLFFIFVINCFLYLFNNTIVEMMIENNYELEVIEGFSYRRNLVGFPLFILFFNMIILIKYLEKHNFIFICLLVVIFLSVIIVATRGLLITYLFSIVFFVSFYYFYANTKHNNKVLEFLFYGFFFFIILSQINFAPLQFMLKKMDVTTNYELRNNVGTFAFRESLILKAYSRVEQENKILFGKGYMRESSPGSYDFVLGGDTYIPPVLYTEGVFGLIVRILPIIYFLFIGFNVILRRYSNKSQSKEIYMVIIVLIITSIIAYMQTEIFMNYTSTILIFFYLQILEEKFMEFNGN